MRNKVLVILTTIVAISLCSCINMSPTQPPAPPPEYHELSFDLTLSEGQEYDVYSFPVYLRNNQTLHLSFFVEEGDHIWFGFTCPSGKSLGIVHGSDSDFALQEACCSRLLGGTMVFKPSEYGCGGGYYQMRPHLGPPSSKARVKVEYWIENPK